MSYRVTMVTTTAILIAELAIMYFGIASTDPLAIPLFLIGTVFLMGALVGVVAFGATDN